jgi:N-acetylglucosamine-6-sulfatase
VSRALSLVVAACFLFGLPAGAAADPPEALSARPNIVMFYIDDAAPHDGRLWNDPTRTPNIYDRFVNHGIEFKHAIGEDPLCCPARGNMLTGLHTHNNGVIDNNALLFDPQEHIGKAMKDAGYASMFIGKYLNRNSDLTPEQWLQHDAGWSVLDVTKGTNGAFMNFPLHTKEGTFQVKGVHSTKMVGDRAVMRFSQTPASQPIFAVLSIFNLHGPNTPQAQDVGDPRCASMPPWNPPNYNEADVSDKPAAIQALAPLPYPDGWPMVRYCEELLGIDRAVGQVTAELAAEGRLDNTLLVFTADNGMAWGQHRLAQNKTWPYTTPVPLYMSWPAAGWGATHTEVDEIVSNIDYAPTFCELAGSCVLGPFAHGNGGPDGVSIVDLANGDTASLGRDAVLEASYIKEDFSYTALRTTADFDAAKRWHYVEYTGGARELYENLSDPWELQNLASQPAYAAIIATLHARLAELRVENIGHGVGSVRVKLDAVPDRSVDYTFTGDFGTFKLDDDTDPTLPNQVVFNNVQAGIFEVDRARIAPWNPSDITCDDVYMSELSIGRLLLYVHPGEEITCTYVDGGPRPDAMIALTYGAPFKKDNLYQVTPAKKQTVTRTGAAIGGVYDFVLRMQNDSKATEALTLSATATGPGTVATQYFWNGPDVTSSVVGGTFMTGDMLPGAYTDMVVRVTVGFGTPSPSAYKLVLRVGSASSPGWYDAVKVVVKR